MEWPQVCRLASVDGKIRHECVMAKPGIVEDRCHPKEPVSKNAFRWDRGRDMKLPGISHTVFGVFGNIIESHLKDMRTTLRDCSCQTSCKPSADIKPTLQDAAGGIRISAVITNAFPHLLTYE